MLGTKMECKYLHMYMGVLAGGLHDEYTSTTIDAECSVYSTFYEAGDGFDSIHQTICCCYRERERER